MMRPAPLTGPTPALALADLGTWEWDLRTRRVWWSAAHHRLCGTSATDFAADPEAFERLLHPDDREAFRQSREHACADGGEFHCLFRVRRASDGVERWMEGAGEFRYDEDGVAVRASGTLVDVTDRIALGDRGAQEPASVDVLVDELLQREREFQAMADNIPQIAWMCTAGGSLYWYNQRWYEFTGLSVHATLRAALADIVHPDHVERVGASFRHAVEIGEPWEDTFPMRRVDGTWRWFLSRASPIRDDGGRVVRWFGTNTDVTERLEAEREQQAQRDLLDTVLANVPLMIVLMSVDGRITWANREFTRLLGWSVEEMEGRDMLAEFYPDPAYRAAAAAYMAQPGADWRRFDVRARDGRVVPSAWTNVKLSDGRHLGIGRDESTLAASEAAQARLQDQLRQAQKMEAIGQLAGGIAHDFNNLLTAIIGNTELARAELPRGVHAQAELVEVESAARRAAGLTRQLLAFSRKQVLQPRRVDLNEVVRGAERLLRRVIGEEIVLETALAPDECLVLADPGQLEQVLLNLAVNARDAMLGGAHGHPGRGGVLTIETALRPRCDAEGGSAGPCAQLLVRDTGHGMDAETRAHVFEPFFTTKPIGQGTGLGLATVYGIVTQSGGTIRVDSAPGEGTSFSLCFPLLSGGGDDVAGGYAMPVPHGSGTVLLVEDETLVRTTVRRMLERHGYAVLEARHGADALAIWREHRARVVALLTDVRMPEMGGIELASLVHVDAPGLPVVFISGYVDQQEAEAAERGFHVAKPFTSDALVAALHDAVAAAR